MKLACLHVLVRSVSDVNFDIHSDSHPTIGMETSSSYSGLTNTETGSPEQIQMNKFRFALIIKVLSQHVRAVIQQTTLIQYRQ